MKILVIGASKGTGALAAKLALERGHDVTVFARSPQNFPVEHPKLTRMRGDFHDRSSVEDAVGGKPDAIILTAATTLKGFREDPTFFSRGTGHIIDAMKMHGLKRLVVLTALGVGDSRKLCNFFMEKILVSFILKAPYQDHERQEKLVRDSGLDWVIARPTRLTDGPARKRYTKTAAIERVPSSISRADVADFLVEATEVDTWVHQAVQLGG